MKQRFLIVVFMMALVCCQPQPTAVENDLPTLRRKDRSHNFDLMSAFHPKLVAASGRRTTRLRTLKCAQRRSCHGFGRLPLAMPASHLRLALSIVTRRAFAESGLEMIGLRFELRDQLLGIIQYKCRQIRALYACDSCPRDQEAGALTRE